MSGRTAWISSRTSLAALGHHHRALVTPRVTGAALELVAQAQCPRLTRDVGVHDLEQLRRADLRHGTAQGAQVNRVEMNIRQCQRAYVGTAKAPRDLHNQVADDSRSHRNRSRERRREPRRCVGQGGKQNRRQPGLGELLGTAPSHRLANHDVGAQRQVRPVSFDGAQRQNCHRSRAIEVAHLFPRHLGKSLDRHGGDYTAATSSATTLSLAVVEELELAAEDVVTVGDWDR